MLQWDTEALSNLDFQQGDVVIPYQPVSFSAQSGNPLRRLESMFTVTVDYKRIVLYEEFHVKQFSDPTICDRCDTYRY